MRCLHGSVTAHMNASAEKVWSLISNVTQVARFGPETFEAQWLDGPLNRDFLVGRSHSYSNRPDCENGCTG